MSETVTVSSIAPGGDGRGVDAAGDVCFVPGGLPGETWQRTTGGGWHLIAAHPDRHGARCSQFDRCGGCTAHHMPDDLYLDWKRQQVMSALSAHRIDPGVVMATFAVPVRSRRRAVLAVARTGGGLRIGFHEGKSHGITPIADCAVLCAAIMAALPGLARLADAMLGPAEEGRLTVLASDSGLDVALTEPDVTLDARRRALVADLCRAEKLARVSVKAEPVITLVEPTISFAGLAVAPPPGAFVQAVGAAEGRMIDLVSDGVGGARRVCDLFSGLGTFALPLARKASILAVDNDAAALAALGRAQRTAGGLKPIEVRRRDLFREPLSPRELVDFDAVVLDPPRAGAREQAERIARSEVRRVAMVSCNPATLGRDLRILIDGGYRLKAVYPVDQFLFSAHVEAVALLDRPRPVRPVR